MFRGGRGGYNNTGGGYQNSSSGTFNNRQASGGFGNNSQTSSFNNANSFNNTNQIILEITGWQNASPQDLAGFLNRKTRITVRNLQPDNRSGVLRVSVNTQKEAEDLVRCTGMRFAQNTLRVTKAQGGSVGPVQTNHTIELLKMFITTRYNAAAKMLDLTNMVNDQTLVSNGVLSNTSTSSKFFAAMMKVATQEGLAIETVSLSDNNLDDRNRWPVDLAQAYPTLKNLAIANNNIRKQEFFDRLKDKLPHLRELIVTGNPIANYDSSVRTIVETFPRLIILNGQQVRDEAKINALLQFPVATKSMFFETPDLSKVGSNFLATYLNMWDNNRTDLLQLYTPDSQFSYQVDTVHIAGSVSATGTNWANYLLHSRNLKRVSGVRPRMSKLYVGTEAIGKSFLSLPKTKHSIQEHPEWYSLEVTSFPPLNGMQITTHGEFNEVAQPEHPLQDSRSGPRYNKPSKPRLEKRSFDRTFIVIPGANGSFVVASDLLLLKPFGGNAAFLEKKPAQAVPAAAPTATPAAPTTPVSAGSATGALPPDVAAKLTPVQQQLVVRIMAETHLNLQFTIMLCEQSNWSYENAGSNFASSKSQIPPNAYQ